MNKATAKYMRKSESFIKKWVKRYLENVDDLLETGLSKRGFDCLFLFMNNLNAEKMRFIYQKCLLKSTERFFSSDVTS